MSQTTLTFDALTRVTTQQQRTHRHLRLAIGGTVVIILATVVVTSLQDGLLLSSISAYFYTPARGFFVGALLAAALGILALSGHGLQRILLDAAGVLAPLVALVPTPIAHGSVPGFADSCPDDGGVCVPAEFVGTIDLGVNIYLAVGVLGLGLAIAVAVAPSGGMVSRARTVLPSLAVSVGILGLTAATFYGAHDWFLANAHFAAASLFFCLIALVALVNAIAAHVGGARAARMTDPSLARRGRWLVPAYWAVAAALILDIFYIASVVQLLSVDERASPPLVLFGEVAALLLFLVFWSLQSYQTWVDEDRPWRGRWRHSAEAFAKAA